MPQNFQYFLHPQANMIKRQQTEGRAKPKLVSKPPGIPLIQLSEKDKKLQGHNKSKGMKSVLLMDFFLNKKM